MGIGPLVLVEVLPPEVVFQHLQELNLAQLSYVRLLPSIFSLVRILNSLRLGVIGRKTTFDQLATRLIDVFLSKASFGSGKTPVFMDDIIRVKQAVVAKGFIYLILRILDIYYFD